MCVQMATTATATAAAQAAGLLTPTDASLVEIIRFPYNPVGKGLEAGMDKLILPMVVNPHARLVMNVPNTREPFEVWRRYANAALYTDYLVVCITPSKESKDEKYPFRAKDNADHSYSTPAEFCAANSTKPFTMVFVWNPWRLSKEWCTAIAAVTGGDKGAGLLAIGHKPADVTVDDIFTLQADAARVDMVSAADMQAEMIASWLADAAVVR
jgi:hypothetical protein